MSQTNRYSLNLPPEIREQWQKAADDEGMVLSGWIRKTCEAALAEPDTERDPLDPVTADDALREILPQPTPEERQAALAEASERLAAMLDEAEQLDPEPLLDPDDDLVPDPEELPLPVESNGPAAEVFVSREPSLAEIAGGSFAGAPISAVHCTRSQDCPAVAHYPDCPRSPLA